MAVAPKIKDPPALEGTPERHAGERRRASTFAALRHRNYRLWFFGQMISLMGTWMQSMAQGWVVYQLTGSRLLLGMISFVGTVPTLFLMLPAGVLADRLSKKQVLLATQTMMMLLAFILAVLAGTKVLQVWQIALLSVGSGIANSFDAPARQALAVEMVEDRRDLMNAIAMNSTMFNIGRIAGPALAGIVLAQWGATWCFALNGVSFLAVIAALAAMRLPDLPRASRSETVGAQIMVGLRYVWGSITVRTIIAVMGVASLFAMSYAVLFPALAADVFHEGEGGLAALTAAMGAGALIGSLTVASLGEYRRKGVLLTAGNILFPLALLLFAFLPSVAPAVLGRVFGLGFRVGWLGLTFSPLFVVSLLTLLVVGWGAMVQNATANTLVQSIVPDEIRGRVMSVYMLVFFGSMPFGSLQMGALAQVLGPSVGIAIGAAVALAFAVFTLLAVPKVRQLEI